MTTQQITYFSILPDNILVEIIMGLIDTEIPLEEIYNFIKCIPRVNLLVVNINTAKYLIHSYLPKGLQNILLLFKYQEKLSGIKYFMTFYLLYTGSKNYLTFNSEKYSNIYESNGVPIDKNMIINIRSMLDLYGIYKYRKGVLQYGVKIWSRRIKIASRIFLFKGW